MDDSIIDAVVCRVGDCIILRVEAQPIIPIYQYEQERISCYYSKITQSRTIHHYNLSSKYMV